VLFDGMQVRQDVSVWGVGRGFLHVPIFFFALELRAGKVRALAAGLEVLLLDAAGDEGAGRVLIWEIGTATAGTPGRTYGVVSRAQATIKTTDANCRVSLHNRSLFRRDFSQGASAQTIITDKEAKGKEKEESTGFAD
jgi:hypothetical protein